MLYFLSLFGQPDLGLSTPPPPKKKKKSGLEHLLQKKHLAYLSHAPQYIKKTWPPLYSMPFIWGRAKSASWHLHEIISAFALISVKDSLPEGWPVTSPSSSPLHPISALASNLTWVIAPW